MKRNDITIERLDIRLQGWDASAARELGASIGSEVLQQIAEQVKLPRGRRSIRIAQIGAGKLGLATGSHTPGSRAAIARQIASRVTSMIGTKSSSGQR